MGPGGDDTPPSVSIDSPSDGASFVEGSTVSCEGTAEDEVDGALSGSSVTWESDQDGEIGTGTTVVTSGLSVGSHTVTMTATDQAGNSGSASISITVEENDAPSASIDSPSEGSVFGRGAPVEMRGSASDPEAGSLAGSSLQWSSDQDGDLGTGESVTRTDLTVATHSIRLVATDPQGLADTASVSVTVEPNGQPSASISAPSDGATFQEGTSITFQGSGSDPEDGALTGSSLEWSSDIDGTLGTGESVTRSDLSSGMHTIVLTATDSRGAFTSDSTSIGVEGDPQVTIDQPASQSVFQQGNTVTFQGSATDPTEGTLTGSSLEWSSDLDGTFGTGESVSTSGLSAGPHTITLTATDSDGNSGSASVEVLVEATGFDIRVRFLDDFSSSERSSIRASLDSWEAAVTGDLRPVFLSSSLASSCMVEKRGVDDLAVAVQLADLDGTGGTLAQAGPRAARTNASGDFTTPICGIVTIDRADRGNSQLEQIVTHEVGHVLGIGIGALTGWGSNTAQLGTFDPFFAGSATVSAFDAVGGEAHLSDGVPLANVGGGGTAGAHWREANLSTELMTGFINSGTPNPLSRVTVAALEDIGYTVDLSAADSYSLPMPQTAIWEAEADATLSRPASSGENFGVPSGSSISDTLVAGANNGTWTADPDDERFTGLLRLNVASSLPAGVTLTDATLVLQIARIDAESSGQDIDLVRVTSAWQEDMVTWDTRPGFGATPLRTFPHDSVSSSLRLSPDALRALARDWAAGTTPNNGLAFRAPAAGSDPNFSVGFLSRHFGPLAQVRPRIEVTAETGAGVRRALREPGERIPLGDDVLGGRLHGVSPDGRILRTVEIR